MMLGFDVRSQGHINIWHIMLWNHGPKTASLTVHPVPNLQSHRSDYYHIVNRINIPTGIDSSCWKLEQTESRTSHKS